MALTARILFLCLIACAFVFGGCTDQSEIETPKQTSGLRKKIATPQQPVQTSGQKATPEKKIIATKAKKEAPAQKVAPKPQETPEPATPEKKMLVEPEKSDSLKLAEGFTRKPAFFYDPAGKVDPFEAPFETETDRIGIAPTKKRVQKKRVPLTPLQRIELSQLKLVAIVMAPTGNKALVEEPSGKGFIITQGTYIGQNFGRVKEILKDRVIVQGEVEDFFSGKPKIEITELKLPQKVGDG